MSSPESPVPWYYVSLASFSVLLCFIGVEESRKQYDYLTESQATGPPSETQASCDMHVGGK